MNAHRLGLTAVAALLLGAPLETHATLTYDLRVSDGTKNAVAYPDEVINLDLFAVVTGAPGNAGIEGFQNGYGSIMSTQGGNIQGSLAATLMTPFASNGSQNGAVQDLDTDGDMDIGSNNASSTTSFLFARSATEQTAGTIITDGREFKLATLTFTVGTISNPTDPTPINLNFRVTAFTGVTQIEALWQEDGVAKNSNLNGGNNLPGVGQSVSITAVPEPSSVLLLVLGALGCGARRRRRN